MKERTLKDWFFTTRPWSFVVSVTPVVATIVYLLWSGHGEQMDWVNAVLALIGIVLFHAAGNLISDYYDYKSGIDSKGAICVQQLLNGDFKPSEYRNLGYGLLLAACSLGLVITMRSDISLLYIGVLGCILTVLYTKTKFIALADLNVFIIFGVLPMLGVSLCTTGSIVWETLLLSLPIGFITVAVLHANNTRDIPTDTKANAHSFASVIGEKNSVKLYLLYIWAPVVYTIVMACLNQFPVWSIITVLAVSVVLANSKQALRYDTEGLAAFKMLDLMSAKLQMVFGSLLILSFCIALFV